jgi:hypothetical protein
MAIWSSRLTAWLPPIFRARVSPEAERETLSRDFSPVKMAASSCLVKTVVSREKPSMMEMPPPAPWVVTRGMPALQMSSMSRLMVRRDTSNFSAR